MTRRRKIITEEAPTLGKTVLLLRSVGASSVMILRRRVICFA